MTFYVQYDENGKPTATVESRYAPNHPRQIAFNQQVDITGKIINLKTFAIEEAFIPLDSMEAFYRKWNGLEKIIEALQDPQQTVTLRTDAALVKNTLRAAGQSLVDQG